MSNVTNIQPRLRGPKTTLNIQQPEKASQPVRLTPDGSELFRTYTPVQQPAEALEQALDTYRATVLEMAHERQAFELQMMLKANTAQIKLEAAGYKAMLAGVPESDIYALGEDMADALSSAMETVAGA